MSKVTPSYVFNTIDNPIFPNTGRRLTLSTDFAGLGGNTKLRQAAHRRDRDFPAHQPHFGRIPRQAEYIRPYGGTEVLPLFERLFLGGEYSVRGFDIRTIGPRDPIRSASSWAATRACCSTPNI